MVVDNFALVTVYIDPDVDEHLREQAALLGIGKAELFRRFLAAGMKAGKARPELLLDASIEEGASPLVLKTAYLDPRVDDKLRAEAFDTGTNKNDLMRRYVRVGMRLEDAAVGGP